MPPRNKGQVGWCGQRAKGEREGRGEAGSAAGRVREVPSFSTLPGEFKVPQDSGEPPKGFEAETILIRLV